MFSHIRLIFWAVIVLLVNQSSGTQLVTTTQSDKGTVNFGYDSTYLHMDDASRCQASLPSRTVYLNREGDNVYISAWTNHTHRVLRDGCEYAISSYDSYFYDSYKLQYQFVGPTLSNHINSCTATLSIYGGADTHQTLLVSIATTARVTDGLWSN